MTTEELLSELRGMFQHHPNILYLRKQFEERIWRRSETFHEYVHDKVILANRVPIDDREIIPHLIQGIPDPLLRDQARLHKFKTKEALLEAFEDVMLRGPTVSRGHSDTLHGDRFHPRPGFERSKKEEKRQDTRFCYNCGEANHMGYNCPTRADGVKCFVCKERGHIARKCPKAQAPIEQACVFTQVSRKKYSYTKEVMLNDNKIVALIDTGSDISLMRADQYIRLGCPQLKSEELKFRGVGSDDNMTIGVFRANLIIDDHSYTTSIHVVSDTVIDHKLLLGTDFLDTVETNIRNGNISIQPIVEITKTEVTDNHRLNITAIPSVAQRERVKNLIADHRAEKIKDVPAKILLKDNKSMCMIVDECREELMPRFANAQCEGVNFRRVIADKNEIDGCAVKERVLLKEVEDNLKLVMPKCMTWQVLRDAHERGHFFREKTGTAVNRDCWFPCVKKKCQEAYREQRSVYFRGKKA